MVDEGLKQCVIKVLDLLKGSALWHKIYLYTGENRFDDRRAKDDT